MKVGTLIRHWTWELPQSLLGAILLLFYKKTLLRVIEYKGQKVYIYDQFPGGISLGHFILIDYNRQHLDCKSNCWVRMRLQESIKHESGHGVQSKWWGPLYLLTVGIVSAIWNLLHRSIYKYLSYYSVWPENQANELGGANLK